MILGKEFITAKSEHPLEKVSLKTTCNKGKKVGRRRFLSELKYIIVDLKPQAYRRSD